MCSVGYGRQSLINLIPVNGWRKHLTPSCELVLIAETDVFSACFNVWTICQVERSRYYLQSVLSPSGSDELVCCIRLNFTEFVIKSYSELSCVICIL